MIPRQLNRLHRIFWFTVAILLRPFIKIQNNKIFCYSYNNNKYSCNPRAITEYLLENKPNQYKIYWGFNKGVNTLELDNRIHIVTKYSLSYIHALYSSKFVFNNSRNNVYDSLFVKKRGQKYIQTWHGSFGLKRVEKDVENKLTKNYVKQAQKDAQMCDLMLSNSANYSKLIRKAFWYNGPILEKCMPRNDIFYNLTKIKKSYEDVRKMMKFSSNSKIVLYAPTFRADMKLDYYTINWDKLIKNIQKMLGSEVEILVRLHPNMSSIKNVELLTNYDHVHNITSYPDITEFLLAADIMISDYTSAMFDFVLLDKPCFIYAPDKIEYDRGFYISIDLLPFPIAETEASIISNINNFSYEKYITDLHEFKRKHWGLDEDGQGCKRLCRWMEEC